jgi:phosphatidylserine decarboxylase
MMTSLPTAYIDRRTGCLIKEPIFARGFLDWSYNTAVGRTITRLLLSRRIISHLYGWFHKQRWSRGKIAKFVNRFDIDMSESIFPVDGFTSFNAFFTRRIDMAQRPIDPRPDVLVSPTDSRVLVYPEIQAGDEFPIKRSVFNLKRFLRDDTLAESYNGGTLIVCRLYLSDYHHFHFPDSGVASSTQSINGRCYAVSPYGNPHPPFYSENVRDITRFNSEHFGDLLLVEIGAFTVGSIHQRYTPNQTVTKGTRKGYFEIGGSTVAMLLRSGSILIEDDLIANSRQGYETYLQVGEPIGRAT